MLVVYDFEVFRYNWMMVALLPETQEILTIIDDTEQLKRFYKKHIDHVWVGYNSRGYDQFILKAILMNKDPYDVSQRIVNGEKGWQILNGAWQWQLYNFDVKMKINESLKQLEGFMGNSIEESSVSFEIDRALKPTEIALVAKYCQHDVEQTYEVFLHRIKEFKAQISLIKTFSLETKHISKTKAQLSAFILGAERPKEPRKDEYDIIIPDNLRITKYQHIVDWYRDPINHNNKCELKVDVSGMEHVFAWGGIHGGLNQYTGEGIILCADVALTQWRN